MSVLLDSCFDQVYKYEEIVHVDSIPRTSRNYIECWKLSTEIFVQEVLTLIELYIGFDSDFPYSIPNFYFPSLQFGYLPHIDSDNGKLCLFDEGVSYPVNSPTEILLSCINKAKKLIKVGAEKTNIRDYLAEISNYWIGRYNEETCVDCSFIIYDKIPNETCCLKSISYVTPLSSSHKRKTIEHTLLYSGDKEPFDSYVSRNFETEIGNVLFVSNFDIPRTTPYCLNLSNFFSLLAKEDRRIAKQYINQNGGGRIFFRLTDNKIGGVEIKPVSLRKNGFRKGSLNTTDIYLNFEKKNVKLRRLYGSLYSKNRMVERTNGELMPSYNFLIAGLGSVGSNLVHFLSGYNNVSFTLVDNDILRIDNIGRHLLGFQYVNQYKDCAMMDYLQSVYPDMKVKSARTSLQRYIDGNFEKMNDFTAIFLCVGDYMTESYFIRAFEKGNFARPLFLLWLEPLGTAGHLVYLNPENFKSPIELVHSQTLLYIHNLISDDEYKNPENNFTKRDAGCNGSYALYSENDVLLMLSAFYPIIDKLLKEPSESKCYRWVGNTDNALQKGVKVKEEIIGIHQGAIQEFPL